MSARAGSLGRIIPAFLALSWKLNVVYRSVLLVWMASMSAPLVMLALFRSIAEERAIGAFDAQRFTVYFIGVLVVRQCTGTWVMWEINQQVRSGSLSISLLRPVHPLWGNLCASLSAIPLRAMISLPLCITMLISIDRHASADLAHNPVSLVMTVVSLALAFIISFSISAIIGTLALFLDNVQNLFGLYLVVFAVASGYMLPLALFPLWLRHVLAFTPFPYMIATPVEFIVGLHTTRDGLYALGAQATCAAVVVGLLLLEWRSALKRHAAFGG